MNELRVFVGDRLAGHLTRSNGRYAFEYVSEYAGPPVFLGWEKTKKSREWETFPPAFDGLLPEGVLLDQLLAKHKLDKADKWGQLVAVGRDLTGFVSVLPDDGEEKPWGKFSPGEKPRKRTPIHPPEKALRHYQASEMVAYHAKHKLRMSLSGMQPKVSAVFSRQKGCFQIVESNGSYILKPSPQAFPGAAENEVLTMQLAKAAGIDVPHCGWLQAKDDCGVFWIERFDRWGAGNRHRIRCEDACQILEVPSSWKYAGNLEAVAGMIRQHCSNPRLQLVKFFQRILFCWVTGNGDMHLKNWSLIENGPLIELAPAYDLLNTRILIDDEEESALTLDGQKHGFDHSLLIDYLGRQICGVNERMRAKLLNQLKSLDWPSLISGSKLSSEARRAYENLVRERLGVLLH
ncbi:MAG: type II toxin-antitoxin system HipA family toxin [Opitutales bacterium]|nr:type II toxin-antitoxin system HipA family toxin [Opitutales bacterium]MCH8540680.1 type II toxin-antitoxin system HipA family toxin [Opitutales bacterium]